MRKSAVANTFLLATSCILAFILFEVLLRSFEPIPMRLEGNRIKLNVNQKIVMLNDKFDKLDPVIIHSKNSIGFRGEKPPLTFDNHLTIVAVGGSTTEGYYLSDGRTWPEILDRILEASFSRVWVNNAGIDGHSTYGHAFLIQDYIKDIRPKIVLFLVGINDIGLDKSTPFDDSFVNLIEFWKSQPRHEKSSIFEAFRKGEDIVSTLAEFSQVVSLALNISRHMKAESRGLGHKQIDFRNLDIRLNDELEEKARNGLKGDLSSFLRLYKQRLTRLIEITRTSGIEPVLITQPTLWGEGTDALSGVALGPLSRYREKRLKPYNQVTRVVARERNVWLIDLASQLSDDSRYYYDWIHFSNEGSEKVAEIIAAGLTRFLADRYPVHRK